MFAPLVAFDADPATRSDYVKRFASAEDPSDNPNGNDESEEESDEEMPNMDMEEDETNFFDD